MSKNKNIKRKNKSTLPITVLSAVISLSIINGYNSNKSYASESLEDIKIEEKEKIKKAIKTYSTSIDEAIEIDLSNDKEEDNDSKVETNDSTDLYSIENMSISDEEAKTVNNTVNELTEKESSEDVSKEKKEIIKNLEVNTFSEVTENVFDDSIIQDEENADEPLFEITDPKEINGTKDQRINYDDKVDAVKDLESFTFLGEFKPEGNLDKISSLFFVGSSKENEINDYLNFYTIASQNKLGFEIRAKNESGQDINLVDPKTMVTNFQSDLSDGKWHQVAFIIDKDKKYQLYLDGEYENKKWSRNKTYSIKDLGVDIDTLSFGGGNRAGNANSYPFTGMLRNIQVFNKALTPEEVENNFKLLHQIRANLAVDMNNIYKDDTATYQIDHNLEKYTLISRYIIEDEDEKSLIEFNDGTSININKKDNQIILKSEDGVIKEDIKADISRDGWYTLSIKSDGKNTYIYINGEKTLDLENGFSLNKASEIKKGNFENGGIDYLKIYDDLLDDSQIENLGEATQREFDKGPDPSKTHKTSPIDVFYPGLDDSPYYRIPAMITSEKGTVIAGTDKRNTTEADWGNIDAVIRRKEVGSDEFSDPITILDLPGEGNNAAFNIDSEFLSVKNGEHKGRIYMLTDVFSKGGSYWASEKTTGYKEIDGKKYLILMDENKEEYTVREGGLVYDSSNNPTVYKVKTEDMQPFSNIGNLYKDDKKIGNIYLRDSELAVSQIPYLWLTYSDDDGITWSSPKDITSHVKDEEMNFLGTGPGRGIQLQDGRLVFSVYYNTKPWSTSNDRRESAAIIYSDDYGKTWSLGKSPNDRDGYDSLDFGKRAPFDTSENQVLELNDGRLMMFMRNTSSKLKYAISKDKGETWENLTDVDFESDPTCMVTAIKTERDGKEYVLVANPNKVRRDQGGVKLGLVDEDGISWLSNNKVNNSSYAYSALTQIDNDTYGLLYEETVDGRMHLKYTEFDFDWASTKTEDWIVYEKDLANPTIKDISTSEDANKLRFEVTFDQNIFTVGDPFLNIETQNGVNKAKYLGKKDNDILIFELDLDDEIQYGKAIVKSLDDRNAILTNVRGSKLENKELNKYAYNFSLVSQDELSANASSEANGSKEGSADFAIDGDRNTWWHTHYGSEGDGVLPQDITIHIENEEYIDALIYTPRPNGGNGSLKDYLIYVSSEDNPKDDDWILISKGKAANLDEDINIEFKPVWAKHIKLVYNNTSYGQDPDRWASAAEINLRKARPVSKDKLDQIVNDAKKEVNNISDEERKKELLKELLKAEKALEDKRISQTEIDKIAKNIEDILNKDHEVIEGKVDGIEQADKDDNSNISNEDSFEDVENKETDTELPTIPEKDTEDEIENGKKEDSRQDVSDEDKEITNDDKEHSLGKDKENDSDKNRPSLRKEADEEKDYVASAKKAKKSQKTQLSPKTGVSTPSGIFITLAMSIAGLFRSRKKK